MTFSLDVKKAAEAMQQDVDQVLRASALDIGGNIIKKTPVDKGTARNNWFSSINTEGSVNIEREPNQGGTEAVNELSKAVGMFGMGKTFYMVNRIPYIVHLELGTSRMRAFGMIRRTLDDFQSGLKDILK